MAHDFGSSPLVYIRRRISRYAPPNETPVTDQKTSKMRHYFLTYIAKGKPAAQHAPFKIAKGKLSKDNFDL
jgi:hypothetical protein